MFLGGKQYYKEKDTTKNLLSRIQEHTEIIWYLFSFIIEIKTVAKAWFSYACLYILSWVANNLVLYIGNLLERYFYELHGNVVLAVLINTAFPVFIDAVLLLSHAVLREFFVNQLNVLFEHVTCLLLYSCDPVTNGWANGCWVFGCCFCLFLFSFFNIPSTLTNKSYSG